MEAVKAMIHDQDLPMYLWEEASRTTIYVQNRISHSALGNKTPEEMFSRENTELSHLKIFACPVYIHIPKEKRSKLDPLGKKDMFVGYSEKSKYYWIYILGYHQIELSIDVTFDEDTTFRKSKKYKEAEEENETPKYAESPKPIRNEEKDQMPEDHDMTEPQLPEELPSEMISRKRKPAWDREVIEEAKIHGAPEGTIQERKKPKSYPSYMALMCDLVDKEPTCFEEEKNRRSGLMQWLRSTNPL